MNFEKFLKNNSFIEHDWVTNSDLPILMFQYFLTLMVKVSYFQDKYHLSPDPKKNFKQTFKDIKLVSCSNTVPANVYLFKVNSRNIRIMCEIRLKLTIKTPKRLG